MTVTTTQLWQATLVFAVADALLVCLLLWRLSPAAFRQLHTPMIAITALFWLGLWAWAVTWYWDAVYRHVFPGWSRWILPAFQAGLTTLVAGAAWRVTGRLRLHPLLSYCLAGALWGAASHVWAVQRGIVDRPPMLQGAAPVAAVTFAAFEYVFYWCLIIGLAALVHAGQQWLRGSWPWPSSTGHS
jgi:hypothetical protein